MAEQFVDQEFIHDAEAGVVGDCWRACIATIIGRPRSEVPHFVDPPENDWLLETQIWLREQCGQMLLCCLPKWPIEKSLRPFVILVGRSPRDVQHAVVADARTGEMMHDPHPSRDGLDDVTAVYVFSEPWEATA